MAQETLKKKEDFWRGVFSRCDSDGSGFISVSELRDICQQMTDQEIADMFMDIDDGDKKITCDEFVCEMCKPSLKEQFNHYDTDNSGCLRKEEIAEMMESQGYDSPEEKERLKDILDFLDENGDKKVSYDEFYKKLYLEH